MAPTAEEEVEYESDPEEVKRSLAMRRREASDDEDDESGREDDDDDDGPGGSRRTEIYSDESDDQGGVAEYDNDKEETLGVPGLDGDDSYYEEEEYIEEGYDEEEDDPREHDNRMAGRLGANVMKTGDGDKMVEEEAMKEPASDHIEEEGEEKEKEPFSVPTAGAFYMHDDRFQGNPGGRNRRMRGGRRLWESKDDSRWGHDKFEEMNTHEKQYERRRNSRGRGRGRTRGQERGGYTRGSNSKTFNDNGNQNQFSKVVTRGRGPRRYETSLRNGNQGPSAQNKQSRKFEKKSHLDSGRAPAARASSEIEAGLAKKNVVASILNSASPPFYPSGSSNSLVQKDIQVGMGTLHMNESTSPTGRNSGNTKVSPGSSSVSSGQPSQSLGQGRGASAPGQVFYQQSLNQVDRTSSPMQLHGSSKGGGQSNLQPFAQVFDQHSAAIRPLASSPPKSSSSKSMYPSAEMESASETGALVAKGKGTIQPSGSSFGYGGTQVRGPAGSLAVGHGNPNFPAFLPIMPFAGQQGGVPTFGMAFPGYVQPEHGLGNPEMTWLPILTGPGALGAAYCQPYAAADGSYQARKPGLPSSSGPSSKENITNWADNEQKPLERPEVTNNGIEQRQNNPKKQPRRYSEMSFSK